MPPKRKTKGGKGSKGTGGIIDGVPISEMSREQLEPFVLRIQTELEREREERNYFQIENDKIRTFWEITKQQLEECRAQIKNRDKEIEELEDDYRQEMKLYHQKVKHLMYEQHVQLSETKVENMVVIKNLEDDHRNQETELLNDKCELKSQIRELQEIHLDQIRTINLEYARKLIDVQTEYENNCRVLESKYQSEIHKLIDELELKNDIELSELEERKNKYIHTLTSRHEAAFADIKNYYNKITDDNLNVISKLKEELQQAKKSKEEVEKQAKEVEKQNQALQMPLKMAEQRITELNDKLSLYERDERKWKISQKQINDALKKCNDIQNLYDALSLAYQTVCTENQSLTNKTMEYILDLQQKANLKTLILEKKMAELNSIVEKEETLVTQLLSSINGSKTEHANTNIQAVIEEKNKKISTLNKEISMIMKNHNDMIRNYKIKIKNGKDNCKE